MAFNFNHLNRRRFLKALKNGLYFIGIAVFSKLTGRFINRAAAGSGTVQLNISQPNQPFRVYDRFFMIRDKDRLRFLSRTCPHLGCTVQWNDRAGHMACPCHGSRFTKQGRYLSGPAKADLHELSYELVDENNIKIFLEDG
ncbi:MAG: Rieske 2Fe-2S domain-containing protein [Caldithrix sp.]|nr:Rieske 2Fe-2S domain-containing protein [Caldithrix sp.]